ncbi:MAG: XRE family transcriptional regulator [Mesorhizobium sp.]|uniref:helix-turn-helix domain-containing protein n=1 Tax=Mesorhizobium sp. TaxID=1871066 RepID=UPI000FE8B5EB|nr:helix-turn-helix transcriptional regulator [Mesorhizobium sp.]RWA70456.1 MAG: XRE family transcriptional regulator [Mesorhizobium sp.]RWB96320.1 MAG: XRE family transcriptional regulator [Mesorhizobium sp.]RWK06697.1 MAG: XRE family transcriptional regulator [Mesorhizobium sp.]
MTPAQARAARSLIDWNQSKLAESASLGLSTVVDFERGRRQVSAEAMDAIQRALESAGVEFIPENGGGAGVRLKKP